MARSQVYISPGVICVYTTIFIQDVICVCTPNFIQDVICVCTQHYTRRDLHLYTKLYTRRDSLLYTKLYTTRCDLHLNIKNYTRCDWWLVPIDWHTDNNLSVVWKRLLQGEIIFLDYKWEKQLSNIVPVLEHTIIEK